MAIIPAIWMRPANKPAVAKKPQATAMALGAPHEVNRRDSNRLPGSMDLYACAMISCESCTTNGIFVLSAAQVSPCSIRQQPADYLWNLRVDSRRSPQLSLPAAGLIHVPVQTHPTDVGKPRLVASPPALLYENGQASQGTKVLAVGRG
jgi:hypothetical protein